MFPPSDFPFSFVSFACSLIVIVFVVVIHHHSSIYNKRKFLQLLARETQFIPSLLPQTTKVHCMHHIKSTLNLKNKNREFVLLISFIINLKYGFAVKFIYSVVSHQETWALFFKIQRELINDI